MKVIFTALFLLFSYQNLFAQPPLAQKKTNQQSSKNNKKKINFNGQWKGEFDEVSQGDKDNIGYVLELTTEQTRVTGYSYSYFKEYGNSYYTICRLVGTLNPSTKEIVVTEIERTKYNTPPTFINCFQTHRLHYEIGPDNTELLKGTWEPAPNQAPGCGKGVTVLSRRIVNRTPLALERRRDVSVGMTPTKPAPHKPVAPAPKRVQPPIAKAKPKEEPKEEIAFPKLKNEAIPDPVIMPPKPIEPPLPKHPKLASRRADIVKTIGLENPTFRLDFYDNGEIDGDSISVFFNGKVVLSNQMLTDKPISMTLTLDPNVKENVVTMYAENLGTIPPNTAVMIVTDGTRRYEVRMESDLKKSGSVVFTLGK